MKEKEWEKKQIWKVQPRQVPSRYTAVIFKAILAIENESGKVQDEFLNAKPKENPCEKCGVGMYNCIRGMERTVAQLRYYAYDVKKPDWRCPTKFKWDVLQKRKKSPST